MRHPVATSLAILCAGLAVWDVSAGAQASAPPAAARGQALYAESCASCHGPAAEGVRGRGPSLRVAGKAAVDFMLRTGRMPLAGPGIEPERAKPVFDSGQIDALVAYLGTLQHGGPAIPDVNPARGDVALGRKLFTDSCSGCHQIVGQGGIAPGLVAPALDRASPTEIGEAIRVGPYLMPAFTTANLDDHDVDSIARYVTQVARHPPDRGGWGIGNVGPIPEGMVAWLLAGTALILVARIIGERSA